MICSPLKEVLQEVVIMRPPNIVLISKLPNSAQAHQEREQILLLLLCAAVRCDRRDYFIRQIMDHLTPDVQTGIMDCIKNFTDNPDSVMNFDRMDCSAPDILRVLKKCINQLEEVYLEEIRDLLDQLELLQHKLTNLQARMRLTCRGRARSLGRLGLTGRSTSSVSLGDPTRGEVTTSTPRLNLAENAPVSEAAQLNKSTNPSMNQFSGTAIDGVRVNRRGLDDDDDAVIQSESNDSTMQLFFLDSGMEVDIDGEHTTSINTLYADASDNNSIFTERDKHHLAVELAETKARLRRLRSEMEDQADQLAELHDELTETRQELGQVKEERSRLADAAHSARHWQDEVDSLRETAERVAQLEADNAKLKQRVHEIEYYKVRCQQLTEDLAILQDENAKRSSLAENEECSLEKMAALEQELQKTRVLLTQLEELRNSDLDQIQKLREELCRLGLEQSTRQQMHNQSQVTHDQSDAESTTSHASYAVALSKQLNDSVSVRLDQLETENCRLKKELERFHSDRQNGMSVGEQTMVSQDIARIRELEVRKACEGMAELESSWNQCKTEVDRGSRVLSAITKELNQESAAINTQSLRDHHKVLVEAIQNHDELLSRLMTGLLRLLESHQSKMTSTATGKLSEIGGMSNEDLSRQNITADQSGNQLLESRITQIESERDNLLAQLRELRCKYRLRTRVHPHDEPPSADDEEENEYEEGHVGEVESTRRTGTDCEEADSGNKTGDSTEETEQFGVDPLKRRTFNLPGTNSTRFRERRRRTRGSLECEVVRLSAEIEQLEETNKQLSNELTLSQTECRIKAEEVQSTKQQLEILKTQTDSNPNETKSDHMEAEVRRLKLALSAAELEIRKARRELREVQSNPGITEQGQLLLSKISQLEVQLSKSSQAHQTATSQYESHAKRLEQEQFGLSQQLATERHTVLTLREQLVEAKIELQQRRNTLQQLQLGLESMGVEKEKTQSLVALENANSCSNVTLQDLIADLVNREVEKKQEELKHSGTDQLKLPSQTETPKHGGCGEINDQMGAEMQTQLLIQLKNRLVELERENAQLEVKHSAESADSVDARARVVQLEHRLSTAQDQLISGQSRLAELIATNARLQVESTTLHNQLDSLANQNDCLFRRNTDLEGEASRLRAMVESAHAAEAHLTADYYHLQRLHEKLTRDYDSLGLSLKEAKEAQRRTKNELSGAKAQIEQLKSASDQVLGLKKALELERGSLKGEAKQMVMLREDCARLCAQVDAITESRDRERMEKVTAVERAREAKHQLEECEHLTSRLTLDLDNQRRANQKVQIEVADLRSRVQDLTDLNSRLEKDNRSLVLQLQSLLGQNQELLASTLETCTHRVVEEGSLRERLLSLQRQKQHLEDKMMEQYRSSTQTRKTQKRMNLVQKAKAALAKRKDILSSHQNGEASKLSNTATGARDTFQSIQSQYSLSNESSGSSNSLSSTSARKSQSTTRLIPGSVSMYDRDPDECDTSEFHVFLKRLNSSVPSGGGPPSRGVGLRTGEDKKTKSGECISITNSHNRLNYMDLTTTDSKSPRAPLAGRIDYGSLSPTSEVIRSARHPSGEQPKDRKSSQIRGLPRSNSSFPIDQFHQQHHFPHKPITKTALNTQLDALRGKSEFVRPDHGRSRSEIGSSTEFRSALTDSRGRNYHPLPCTDRCEKQLCEIVTTKAASEEYGCLPNGLFAQSGSGDVVSRSSSIHSFTSGSASAQAGPIGNGSLSSLVTSQPRTVMNSMTSAAEKQSHTSLQNPLASKSSPSYTTESSLNDITDPVTPKSSHAPQSLRWLGKSGMHPAGHVCSTQSDANQQPNSMESVYGCRSPRVAIINSNSSPRGDSGASRRDHGDLDQRPTLEVVGRPRVLLEYGDL
ncbi:hypothetical protein FGIG_05976 [Fasciola gigantica]|uniref:HOOK N-terminal domain-containing protein n=1 Tax=Fasciola gigantica TaxID=46835 RepID=A0A504YU86_FASGI|nr:hypothetical protein FGIG_05976 [Fasciola gigantica]